MTLDVANTGRRLKSCVEARTISPAGEGIADYAIYHAGSGWIRHQLEQRSGTYQGVRAQEIIGQHFSCFYLDQDLRRGKTGAGFAESGSKRPVRRRGMAVRKDGSRFRANSILTSLHDQQGKLIGFVKLPGI